MGSAEEDRVSAWIRCRGRILKCSMFPFVPDDDQSDLGEDRGGVDTKKIGRVEMRALAFSVINRLNETMSMSNLLDWPRGVRADR
jgi:hypothetical protein